MVTLTFYRRLFALAVPFILVAGVRAADRAPADFTGILIDARSLPTIDRSPAPAIFGPTPDLVQLYPDRDHAPTPDQVQDATVVRYYLSEEAAHRGVCGANPLILKAEAVVGPAHDGLRLAAADVARLKKLDKKLHFSRTWKVGFLLPDHSAPPVIAEAPAAPIDLSACTGIVIDARHLAEIDRSPAPEIHGPVPDAALLYPDRSHVPTPDEVQEESVVRYYHSEDEAKKGHVGANPLFLKAEAVLGPAHDGLRLSAVDMARLQELDRLIHFSRTWKVGFLVPENR